MNYNDKIQKKREKEKYLVFLMIKIFCKSNHKNNICTECMELYDYSKNQITIITPIAKGLLTKKVGDTVTIKVPAGDKVLEILEIGL